MSTAKSIRLESFLQRYEQAVNSTNPADAAGQFSEIFLSAAPSGPTPVPRQAMITALTHRAESMNRAGLTDTRLISWSSTPAGHGYSLLTTKWEMDFDANEFSPAETIEFNSTLLVHEDDTQIEIVLYLPHENIEDTITRRTQACNASTAQSHPLQSQPRKQSENTQSETATDR